MQEYIKISHIDGVWQISNLSEFDLVISQIPIKPKRKNTECFLISPGRFLLIDVKRNEVTLDITKLSFQFKPIEKS